MVSHSRTAASAPALRPLNQPRPITISTHGETHRPVGLIERGRHHPIARVQDSWCIEDEWWREPIRRRYYQLVLNDGNLRTVYHDLVADRWYEQRY